MTTLNLSITPSADGLRVCEVDNSAYLALCAEVGMMARCWQLPQHDVRYVAPLGLARAEVKGAVADYLNGLIRVGRVG